MSRSRLGRGLSQLISSNALSQSRAVIEVTPDRLQANPFQPRRGYDIAALDELAESICQQGILQPLLVRPAGDDYQIILGERRWRAAQQAGLETVPCIVQEVEDRQALEMALIENLHREDLNAVERARAYQQLVDDFEFTHEELAQHIGKSRSAITNTLRLLQLPEEVLASLAEGNISEGHGRALLSLEDDPDSLREMWRTVESEELSVRATEELVREALGRDKSPAEARRLAPVAPPPPDPHLTALGEHLQETLATEVKLRYRKSGGGMILIRYSDSEELQRIVEHIAPGDYL